MDVIVLKTLAAPIRQNHQIHAHADGDDLANLGEIGCVLWPVDRTTKHDEFPYAGAALASEHRDAPTIGCG